MGKEGKVLDGTEYRMDVCNFDLASFHSYRHNCEESFKYQIRGYETFSRNTDMLAYCLNKDTSS